MTHFGVAVAAGIGLDALLGRTRGATARVAAAVAVIAVLVDLGLANVTDGRLPYDAASAAAYRRHATFYSELGRSLGSARAVWLPQIRAIDIKLAGRFGLRRLDDTEPLNLRRQSEYFTYFQHGRSHMPDAKRFFAGEVIPEWRLPVDELSSRFADMAGRRRLLDLAAVAAFVTPREIGSAQRASSVAFAERAGLDPPDWKAEFAVRRNPHALPRAFVTHRVKPAPDTDKLLGLLADPSFDPLVFSYAEGDVAIPVTPLTPTRGHPAQIAVDEHTVVEVEAEVPAPGLLVLADAYFRGWRAEIDGEPAPIVAVNHLFRGVAVSRGRHRVRFEYRPLSVPIGIGVSLAAVGLIGFGFARSRG